MYNVFLSRRLRAAQFTERQIRMELFPLVFSFIQPSGRSFPKQQATIQTKKRRKKKKKKDITDEICPPPAFSSHQHRPTADKFE